MQVYRHHGAFALRESMNMSMGIGTDEELLQVKRGISDPRTPHQSFHLLFHMNRAEVVNLDTADHSASGHHIPMTSLA